MDGRPCCSWAEVDSASGGLGQEEHRGPIYSADPYPYLIWGQMERLGVSPRVNLRTLASGERFLWAGVLSWGGVGLWGWHIFKVRRCLNNLQS